MPSLNVSIVFPQALRRYQGNKVHNLGAPALIFLLFYTLWDDIRVTKLIAWECLHSTLLVCFTRLETTPG
jgi:hypothetical protein